MSNNNSRIEQNPLSILPLFFAAGAMAWVSLENYKTPRTEALKLPTFNPQSLFKEVATDGASDSIPHRTTAVIFAGTDL